MGIPMQATHMYVHVHTYTRYINTLCIHIYGLIGKPYLGFRPTPLRVRVRLGLRFSLHVAGGQRNSPPGHDSVERGRAGAFVYLVFQ